MKPIRLRPHHVWGLHSIDEHPETYSLPDAEFLKLWRKTNGDYHSDKLVLHWRDTIKFLYEHPDHEFEYISGKESRDSVCVECDKECDDPEHENFKLVEQWDTEWVHKEIPFIKEMKFGKKYTFNKFRELKLKLP